MPWLVSGPTHVTDPAIRAAANSLLQGAPIEVERNNLVVRAVNGLGKHANTDQMELSFL